MLGEKDYNLHQYPEATTPMYSRESDKKAYAQLHYEANKPRYVERAALFKVQYNDKVDAFISDYLRENPCVDCGESDIIVLEFDHRNPKEKSFAIGVAKRAGYGLHKIKAEIEKCDVRCANCHRRKTYKESGHKSRS